MRGVLCHSFIFVCRAQMSERQCSANKFYSRGQMSHVLKILCDRAIKTSDKNIKKQIQISQ